MTYRASVDSGGSFAVKWFRPGPSDVQVRDDILNLIRVGAPHPSFLWPLDLVESPDRAGFGYLMPLRQARFISFGEVLRRHPTLPAVIAHLGMPEYEAFLQLAERYDRVRLDTTMAFTDFVEARTPFPSPALPRLSALRSRVLLGTDFPNTPYPYAHQLAALARLGLGHDWLRAVLHDNAAALFDVPTTRG